MTTKPPISTGKLAKSLSCRKYKDENPVTVPHPEIAIRERMKREKFSEGLTENEIQRLKFYYEILRTEKIFVVNTIDAVLRSLLDKDLLCLIPYKGLYLCRTFRGQNAYFEVR